MRVMSWNLWWRFGADDQVTVGTQPPSAGDWRMRERGILSTLEAVRPDIAGLQEVWATAETTQAEVLAERLGMHAADNPLAPREAWQIDHRIDYVMARPGSPEHPVAVERVFVAGVAIDGLHPSDHDAVVADLRW